MQSRESSAGPIPAWQLSRCSQCLVHPFRSEGFVLPVVEAMACGLPVIVTGAGSAVDYATDETAYLIPARQGQFAECRVGDLETIGRPWLFEPDVDALVELLKRVASDLPGARGKGMAASAWIPRALLIRKHSGGCGKTVGRPDRTNWERAAIERG